METADESKITKGENQSKNNKLLLHDQPKCLSLAIKRIL